jgi:hypothetical protein
MSHYARRTDGNHRAFAALFTKTGYKFIDVHGTPGLLDFLVMSRTGRILLFEVKNPTDPAPITSAERETLAMFSGAAFVVCDEQDALNILYAVDGIE